MPAAWAAHYDKVRGLWAVDDPFSDDYRHNVGRLGLRQATVMC
jgi:hypothetical protein